MSFQKKLFLKLLNICVLICWTAMYITDRTTRSRTPVWNVGISKDYLTSHPHPAKGFNKLSPTCLGESVLEHSQSRMMQLIASMCQIKLLFLYSSVLSFERILFGWSWGRLLDKLCWHGSVLPTRSVRSVLRLCVCVTPHSLLHCCSRKIQSVPFLLPWEQKQAKVCEAAFYTECLLFTDLLKACCAVLLNMGAFATINHKNI